MWNYCSRDAQQLAITAEDMRVQMGIYMSLLSPSICQYWLSCHEDLNVIESESLSELIELAYCCGR